MPAKEVMGKDFEAVHILQLTHSGRYSRPSGTKGKPIIAQHDPYLDPRVGIQQDMPVVSDEYLDTLPQLYAEAAVCAKNAGFDGVDIKACHRYLMSELLAAFTRPGKYGGNFEKRTRLLRDCIRAVRKAAGEDFIIACRFNVFDAHPYPYGFGCDKNDFWKFDSTEPRALVEMLCREGVSLLSNSAGNPYYIYPQVTRPFDTSSMGIPVPDEHPLESISRAFAFTRLIQKTAGEVPVVGNAYTWLRQYIPYAGAANLADGSCRFVGLGRSSIAYPDAPRDVLSGRGDGSEEMLYHLFQVHSDHAGSGQDRLRSQGFGYLSASIPYGKIRGGSKGERRNSKMKKTAVITGASRGIGFAIARQLERTDSSS